MSLPLEIVFARHGQSETGVLQKRDDHGLEAGV